MITINIKRCTINGVKTYVMINPFTNAIMHVHTWSAVEVLARRLKVTAFKWIEAESTNAIQVLK
jgi:hypothetical protein